MDSDDDDPGLHQDLGQSYASAARGKPNNSVSSYIQPASASHVRSSIPSEEPSSGHLIADSGATDHMWPDYNAFCSYHPVSYQIVSLADSNHAEVCGIGTIKIRFDGKVIGVRDVLYVPSSPIICFANTGA